MRRKIRRNQGGFVERLTGNLRELTSMDFLKRSGQVAIGSVSTPVVSGVVTGLANRFSPGLVAEGGLVSRGVDLLSAGLTAALTSVVVKDPEFITNVLLGGVSGIASDVASDTLLPAFNLGEFLTQEEISSLSGTGMGEYLTTSQAAAAREVGTVGESF